MNSPAGLPRLNESAARASRAERPLAAWLLTNEFGLFTLILAFGAAFALGTPGFGSAFNLFTLGRVMAIDIMIGFSMMVVIVTGGLNLSVGAIGVCSAMAFGWLAERAGLPLALAIPGALAVGGLLGAINGQLIVRSGLHSFIITLATMSVFFGVMVFATRAEAFRALPAAISAFGKTRYLGYLSPLLLVSAAVGLALAALYRLTPLGREMLAAGARAPAAELSGVRVGRTFVLCHMLSGVLAGVAALMVVARTGAALPSMAGDLGQDWLLPAFLGPVLGGAALAGGRVSVLGAFLGAALVSELSNGLLQFRVGEFWVQTYLGLLLLIAVLLDLARRTFLARIGRPSR
ncbi:MAG: ABC transporter permease [Pseudomonadota bacterium]|nr:ABC transporter permease [Pseudomonadota bacterium]